MKPRHRYPGNPDTTAVDYITLCISTYRDDLARLDAEVRRRRAQGDRKASRSAVIRDAVRRMTGG